VVSEQEELAAASRVRGKWFWLSIVVLGTVFIAVCVIGALAPEQYAVRHEGTLYGNCEPSSDASSVSCAVLNDLDMHGTTRVKVGDTVYGNCQGVGEAHPVHVLWAKRVWYDSIVCSKIDAG